MLFQPIASSELVTGHLARLLETATDYSSSNLGYLDTIVWDELDAQHYSLWSDARTKHQQRTQELAEYRRVSLSTSHTARKALLEEQLQQTNNDKIQKMRESQIATAEADYARRIQELDIAIERADVIAGTVAYGLITVTGEKS